MTQETRFISEYVSQMKHLPDTEYEMMLQYNVCIKNIPEQIRTEKPGEIKYKIFKQLVKIRRNGTDISKLFSE